MGKFADLAIAIIILIVGLYVLTKLGITFGSIWHMLRTFFSSSSPATNSTASSILVGMTMTNSQVRHKLKEKKEMLLRRIKAQQTLRYITQRVRKHE
jgi:hypothetical protein